MIFAHVIVNWMLYKVFQCCMLILNASVLWIIAGVVGQISLCVAILSPVLIMIRLSNQYEEQMSWSRCIGSDQRAAGDFQSDKYIKPSSEAKKLETIAENDESADSDTVIVSSVWKELMENIRDYSAPGTNSSPNSNIQPACHEMVDSFSENKPHVTLSSSHVSVPSLENLSINGLDDDALHPDKRNLSSNTADALETSLSSVILQENVECSEMMRDSDSPVNSAPRLTRRQRFRNTFLSCFGTAKN